MSKIKIMHGSNHIIKVPDIAVGNPHNDYGRGFYCTELPEMAREWACKQNTDGFVNYYELETGDLKILNLTDGIADCHFILFHRNTLQFLIC